MPKALDPKQIGENYKLEQQQRKLERELRKLKRLKGGSLSEEDRKLYGEQVEEKQRELRNFVTEHSDVLRRDYWRENVYGASSLPSDVPNIKQFEKYRERLGDDAPQTIEEFNRIKFRKGDEWNQLQEKYQKWLYDQDYSDIMHLRGKLSNYQVRRWYVNHSRKIPSVRDENIPLEEQARQCYELRSMYKRQARELMSDREEAERLNREEPIISFDELILDKMKRKSMTREEALLDIIESAGKTRKSINDTLNIQ